MTQFGAIEAKSGRPYYAVIPGEVELIQREAGSDVTAKFLAGVTEAMLDNLQRLVTKAYGNPPLPEIEISVKADRSGKTVLNGNKIVLEHLLVGSGSIFNIVKLDPEL